jgi:hypothetical protein
VCTTKVAYNALDGGTYTDPIDLPRRSSFAYCYPRELQQEVLRKWTSYGFESPDKPRWRDRALANHGLCSRISPRP